MRYASVDARSGGEAVAVVMQAQPDVPAIGYRTVGASAESVSPAQRRERERLAILEAQIAQTCYELSRLRGEHRRISSRLAGLEATAVGTRQSDPQ